MDGLYLQYSGDAEYEYWNEAVNKTHYLDDDHSFACVWVPGVQGHCHVCSSFGDWLRDCNTFCVPARPYISQQHWTRYQSSLSWIHDQLTVGYAHKNPTPECDNCGWFDPWAINVIRCYEDGQALRFAYLDDALYDQQPQFYCTSPGYEGYYYVGIAQKVELEC